jgi:hypothetical protein
VVSTTLSAVAAVAAGMGNTTVAAAAAAGAFVAGGIDIATSKNPAPSGSSSSGTPPSGT